MKKIKVLEFADCINKDDFIDTIIQFSNSEKFQVDVCVRTLNSNIAEPVFSPRTSVFLIPGLNKSRIFFSSWKLFQLLRRLEIDILHAHHFDQIIIGWLATRLHKKTKLVIGRHYSDSLYRMPNDLRKSIYFFLEKLANRAAWRIVVPSIQIRNILIQQAVPEKKIQVIYYGFNLQKYKALNSEEVLKLRSEFGLDGKIVLGCFARLHEEKGHRYLLDAVCKISRTVKNLRVLFIGEGPERSAIQDLIIKYDLNDIVTLAGWRMDAIKIMQSVDIVVQPTLQEAFSQVMCEAMYLGKPLIISRVSGVEDIVINNFNGIVVEKESVTGLVDGINGLINSSSLREKLGKNAKETIIKKLPLHRVIDEYEKLFSESIL